MLHLTCRTLSKQGCTTNTSWQLASGKGYTIHTSLTGCTSHTSSQGSMTHTPNDQWQDYPTIRCQQKPAHPSLTTFAVPGHQSCFMSAKPVPCVRRVCQCPAHNNVPQEAKSISLLPAAACCLFEAQLQQLDMHDCSERAGSVRMQ